MKNKLNILPVFILSLVLLATGCSAAGVAVLPADSAGNDINVTTGTQPPAATTSVPVTTDPGGGTDRSGAASGHARAGSCD